MRKPTCFESLTQKDGVTLEKKFYGFVKRFRTYLSPGRKKEWWHRTRIWSLNTWWEDLQSICREKNELHVLKQCLMSIKKAWWNTSWICLIQPESSHWWIFDVSSDWSYNDSKSHGLTKLDCWHKKSDLRNKHSMQKLSNLSHCLH